MVLTTLALSAWVVGEGRQRLSRRALAAWAAATLLATPVALSLWLALRPGFAPTERRRFTFLRAWMHVTALVAVAGLLSMAADVWLGQAGAPLRGLQRPLPFSGGGLFLTLINFWVLLWLLNLLAMAVLVWVGRFLAYPFTARPDLRRATGRRQRP